MYLGPGVHVWRFGSEKDGNAWSFGFDAFAFTRHDGVSSLLPVSPAPPAWVPPPFPVTGGAVWTPPRFTLGPRTPRVTASGHGTTTATTTTTTAPPGGKHTPTPGSMSSGMAAHRLECDSRVLMAAPGGFGGPLRFGLFDALKQGTTAAGPVCTFDLFLADGLDATLAVGTDLRAMGQACCIKCGPALRPPRALLRAHVAAASLSTTAGVGPSASPTTADAAGDEAPRVASPSIDSDGNWEDLPPSPSSLGMSLEAIERKGRERSVIVERHLDSLAQNITHRDVTVHNVFDDPTSASLCLHSDPTAWSMQHIKSPINKRNASKQLVLLCNGAQKSYPFHPW